MLIDDVLNPKEDTQNVFFAFISLSEVYQEGALCFQTPNFTIEEPP